MKREEGIVKALEEIIDQNGVNYLTDEPAPDGELYGSQGRHRRTYACPGGKFFRESAGQFHLSGLDRYSIPHV